MVTPCMAPSSRPVFCSSTVFPLFKIKEVYWIKYTFRLTGLSHDAKPPRSVYIRASNGFIQFANRKHAVKSPQSNHHFQSHLIFWTLDIIRSTYRNLWGFSGDQYEHVNISPRNSKERLTNKKPAKLNKENHYFTFKISLRMGLVWF